MRINNAFPLLLLLFLASSCSLSETDTNREEQEQEIKAKPLEANWADAKVRDKAMRAIDKHYVDNTLKQSRLTYEFRDQVKQGALIFFSLSAIHQDSIYPLSGTRAFMRVDTRSDRGDSFVFDYEIKASPAKEKADSLVYEVESLNLRKVNNEQRYILKKEGNFWVKEILAVAQ